MEVSGLTDLSATTGVTDRPSDIGSAADTHHRIREFLDRESPATPCLVIDLATVRHRYARLRSVLPDTRICYAVKANPMPAVIRALVESGCSFDVASPGEIELCLSEGAPPERISYGNTIKKRSDIAWANDHGVRLFATDSAADLDNIADVSPGAQVFCRILVDNKGSRTPFGRKFGVRPETAVELLSQARQLGLDPCGVSFHIGSQQLDPAAWEHGIAAARQVFDDLASVGITPSMVNLGGGLPGTYTESVPAIEDYAAAIERALDAHFGTARPDLLIEPGRYLVADAGILRSEVVAVTPDESDARRRWVFLDIGRYGGLAETEGEAIAYRMETARDSDSAGPVIIAGPTCDGDDVLYQRTPYELPLSLRGGDWVDLLSAGAYTASYSSVGFNGFAPMSSYYIDGKERPARH